MGRFRTADWVQMITTHPARALAVDHLIGSLQAGPKGGHHCGPTARSRAWEQPAPESPRGRGDGVDWRAAALWDGVGRQTRCDRMRAKPWSSRARPSDSACPCCRSWRRSANRSRIWCLSSGNRYLCRTESDSPARTDCSGQRVAGACPFFLGLQLPEAGAVALSGGENERPRLRGHGPS